ncbi:hypothetical protein T12_12679 [Trichinella patagoniensis]|uniref:Uncharacterized protein n=1 Tax=Trichinella patagoniensis TaxID=990121 RepID=A0A0V0Z3Z6_9BILA|nr:hypothetical protein T12_12679 [Trichinella patagoniensis]
MIGCGENVINSIWDAENDKIPKKNIGKKEVKFLGIEISLNGKPHFDLAPLEGTLEKIRKAPLSPHRNLPLCTLQSPQQLKTYQGSCFLSLKKGSQVNSWLHGACGMRSRDFISGLKLRFEIRSQK